MTGFENEEIELPKKMSEKLPELLILELCLTTFFSHEKIALPSQYPRHINFFAPVQPITITMEYGPSRKATGTADVRFDTIKTLLQPSSP